jgi:hypothetical protein
LFLKFTKLSLELRSSAVRCGFHYRQNFLFLSKNDKAFLLLKINENLIQVHQTFFNNLNHIFPILDEEVPYNFWTKFENSRHSEPKWYYAPL